MVNLSSNRTLIICALYIIGLIMAYPIIIFYLETWRVINDLILLPGQVLVQVFLSGPMLIIVGVIFYFKYKHRVTGVSFFALGLQWILGILFELITKN
jgi:hypothetical protein